MPPLRDLRQIAPNSPRQSRRPCDPNIPSPVRDATPNVCVERQPRSEATREPASNAGGLSAPTRGWASSASPASWPHPSSSPHRHRYGHHNVLPVKRLELNVMRDLERSVYTSVTWPRSCSTSPSEH